MDSSRYTSKKFKELQKKWYAKLKETGFKDIERPTKPGEVGDFYPLLTPSTGYLGRKYSEDVEQYFTLAREFVTSPLMQREAPLHVMIWELHSEGKKNTEIRSIIREKLKTHLSAGRVSTLLKTLKMDFLAWVKERDTNG